MLIEMNFISGLMLGFEYVGAGEADDESHLVFDLFFVRILISWQFYDTLTGLMQHLCYNNSK